MNAVWVRKRDTLEGVSGRDGSYTIVDRLVNAFKNLTKTESSLGVRNTDTLGGGRGICSIDEWIYSQSFFKISKILQWKLETQIP